MFRITFDSAWPDCPEFPSIGLGIDITTLVAATYLTDKFCKEHDTSREEVEAVILRLMDIDHWENQRDAARRATQIIGRRELLKRSCAIKPITTV